MMSLTCSHPVSSPGLVELVGEDGGHLGPELVQLCIQGGGHDEGELLQLALNLCEQGGSVGVYMNASERANTQGGCRDEGQLLKFARL